MITGVGLGTAIVSALREYNRSLPIEFLARVLGRDPDDQLLGQLNALAKSGVIAFDGHYASIAEGVGKAKN